MASNLTERLSRLVKTMRGQARITDTNVQDMLREVRMALLEADVALPVVRDFIARVKDKALGQEVVGSLNPGQVLVSIVQKELAATMGEGVSDINLAAQPPAIILMAGLQGAGKTTTTAKLAKHLIERRKKKVLTVSADVYRPAAIEQLKTVTRQAGAEWFPSQPDQQPRDIALAALDYAKKHYFDVLLVDTAGRLAIDEALMAEIRELHAVLNPVETLFVVDAMQGQDAINTARAFKEALPLTGIVLTKLDGDSRGGAALSVRQITGAPIKFAGVSEKIDGLEVFDADRHAGRVLGMGDIVALVEEVQKGVDIEAVFQSWTRTYIDVEVAKTQAYPGVIQTLELLAAQGFGLGGRAGTAEGAVDAVRLVEGGPGGERGGDRARPRVLAGARRPGSDLSGTMTDLVPGNRGPFPSRAV